MFKSFGRVIIFQGTQQMVTGSRKISDTCFVAACTASCGHEFVLWLDIPQGIEAEGEKDKAEPLVHMEQNRLKWRSGLSLKAAPSA